jgi:hypothetical protein
MTERDIVDIHTKLLFFLRPTLRFLKTPESFIRLLQLPPQHPLIPRLESNLIVPAHRHQTRRIRTPFHWMRIDLRVRHNLETPQDAQEDKVEFAIRKQGAGAHAVAQTVCEEWRVGRGEPALGAEGVRVTPYFGVCSIEISVVRGIEERYLPMLHAQALR